MVQRKTTSKFFVSSLTVKLSAIKNVDSEKSKTHTHTQKISCIKTSTEKF